jgi:hypothetical protein
LFSLLSAAKKKHLALLIPDVDEEDGDSNSDQDASSSSKESGPEEIFPDRRYRIPRLKHGNRTKAEIDRIRQDLTNLAHHPDETFRTMSYSELIRLDSRLESSGKSGKKLTEKMARNLEKIKKNS